MSVAVAVYVGGGGVAVYSFELRWQLNINI